MESYKIKITEKARKDLRDTCTYIKGELKEPVIAEKFYLSIEQSVESLVSLPKRHALVRDERLAEKGYRMMPVANHLIFYTVDDNSRTVMVSRILYARRDWLNIL